MNHSMLGQVKGRRHIRNSTYMNDKYLLYLLRRLLYQDTERESDFSDDINFLLPTFLYDATEGSGLHERVPRDRKRKS